MRVFQNLFDFGDTGIVGLSTSNSFYAPVPADFGDALLWKDGATDDLSDLCTRPVEMDAQKKAMAALRAKLVRAVESVQIQLDWTQARLSENYRELPSYAKQLGDNLLLLFFVGAIEPRCWRLIDVARRHVVWESDSDAIRSECGIAGTKPGQVTASQLPLASGADFVEVQFGMSRVVFVLDGEQLVPAEWSFGHQNYADNCGVPSGMLSQPDRDRNVYVLIDPRTGEALKSFPAPTRSKSWSRPATTPASDRIAISHKGGTVDIVDGFGNAHVSIRPFPQIARTEEINVHFSHAAERLGADGWHLFRVVDLAKREVAELSVPEPNMQDDPNRVLYDRAVLATGSGVALMDQSGLSVIPNEDLHWHPVILAGKGASRKSTAAYEKHIDDWRKPALTLRTAKKGSSWMYGAPDVPKAEVPLHDGQPMRLLARIDLGEAAKARPDNPWPKQGALYFFTAVDSEGAPLQDDMFNLNATRVLWRNGPFVAQVDSDDVLASKQPMKLVPHKADLPDIGAAIVEAMMLDDTELEAYRSWLEQSGLADQPSGHRLGGYPTILQHNDLESQAAHFADDAHHPPRDMAEMSAASRWRLLLQLDSDDACMWGTDSGMLYFLIQDDDLVRQDFSRVVSVCEGL